MSEQMQVVKSRRGFASMSREKHRAIASRGGISAHAQGKAHRFSSDEASNAARLGHLKGTAHQFTSAEARLAGSRGGAERARRVREAKAQIEGAVS